MTVIPVRLPGQTSYERVVNQDPPQEVKTAVDTPESIGRYPVERALGAGAFASVWLARDDQLQSYVAIKVLAENWSVEPAVRERFVKEARLLRQADSPHIVQVHDIGELPDGRPYFVMTYADMGTLAGRLADGPLPVPETLRLLGEIAGGVGELHQLGIVHRDLKPSNVLFRTATGGGERAMVADLGVARALADATSHTIAAGTPGYMAPEQMRLDGAPDERADVHGLGALAYHLLTGQVPGSGAVRLAPHRLRPEVPERISAAVMKAIDPDPDRRWPSVADFDAALRGTEPDLPADFQDHGPRDEGPATRPRTPPARALLAGGTALVLAGAVVAVILTRGGGGVPEQLPGTGGGTTASAEAGPQNDLRDDAPVPQQYRQVIVEAGTWCADIKGLSPAFIAAVLKVMSDFDPDLSDKEKDEFGIARWTPRVLRHWQPYGLNQPEPRPPYSVELSVQSMGRFFCVLGPQISNIKGDPAANLAALFLSGVEPMKRSKGIPSFTKERVDLIMKYRNEYRKS
ncbi:serine/threonine-protein kinase [Nonomuraea endophytica]|uniref:serine/threonine-protein kinase n=1 Tax=Nonomuraea endophytica TaxID=714136 RepID=UPI002483E37A|nr:serine/threonine-protein kinase [Nonomuraea endophytica]